MFFKFLCCWKYWHNHSRSQFWWWI